MSFDGFSLLHNYRVKVECLCLRYCIRKAKRVPESSPSNSMATSLISSLLTPPSSSFFHGTKLSCYSPSSYIALSERATARRCFISASAKSFDHIPNQFRGENLKDGCEFLSLSLNIFKFERCPCTLILNLTLYFHRFFMPRIDWFIFSGYLKVATGFFLLLLLSLGCTWLLSKKAFGMEN